MTQVVASNTNNIVKVYSVGLQGPAGPSGSTDAFPYTGSAEITGSLGVTGSILPGEAGVYDLGSEDKYWKDIWVSGGSIKFVSGSTTSSLTSGPNGELIGNFSGSFSGSYSGSIDSASYSDTAVSASYALTASYALNGGGEITDTGSLMLTGSVSSNTLTFTKGDGSTFNLTVDTGSGGGTVGTLQQVTSAGSTTTLPITVDDDIFISHASGSYNIGIGFQSLGNGALNGTQNVALGYASLQNATSGQYNTALGYAALNKFNSVSSGANTAVGASALYWLTTGTNNVAVGASAGSGLSTGGQNIVIGVNANAKYNGSNNVVVGTGAGNSSYLNPGTYGSTNNTFIGYNAGTGITDGTNNIIVGSWSAGSIGIATGNYNTIIGGNFAFGNNELFNSVIIGTGNGVRKFQSSGSITQLYEDTKVSGYVSASAFYGDGSNLTGIAATINTGSLMVTGSVTNNTLTFTKGDGSTFNLTVATGSGGGGGSAFPFSGSAVITGSLVISGSTNMGTGDTRGLQIFNNGSTNLSVRSNTGTSFITFEGRGAQMYLSAQNADPGTVSQMFFYTSGSGQGDGSSLGFINFAQGNNDSFGSIRTYLKGVNKSEVRIYSQIVGVGTTPDISFISGSLIDVNRKIETDQDIEITDSSKGIILKSPGGTRYRVTVDNSGNLITTSI